MTLLDSAATKLGERVPNRLTAGDSDCSLDLPAERAPLREPGEAAGGLAEHDVAVPAQDHRLRVAVDRGDLQAAGALHVHEEAVGGLDHALQLVLLLLVLGVWVEEIDVHGSFARGQNEPPIRNCEAP